MLISKNWLSEFVSFPPKLTPKELGLRLTMAMAEVERVHDQRSALDGVIVAQILDVRRHPNADKLQLATVSTGKETLHIVCGAPNIAAGQKVPLATIGTTLPGGMTIAERAVRGEVSQGMLCAPDELGLGDDHGGILILPPQTKIGQPLARVLGLDDVIIEIDNKSLTHRPDLWGHYGVAREVAAIYGTRLAPLASRIHAPAMPKKLPKLEVAVREKKLCPRYMAVRIDGIAVAPSPKWLADRLQAIGAPVINNIVDVTNYVLHELGQPLHAFDAATLSGAITVRDAAPGERIAALDGTTHELHPSELVIADAQGPAAIAGIIGGTRTAVNDATVSIVLEAAAFDHVAVRKASQRLSIRTEASVRFEKSLDPELPQWALYRAIALIRELCPSARVASAIADIRTAPKKPIVLKLSYAALVSRIGEAIPQKTIVTILTRLGFSVKAGKGLLTITVPSWRATKDIAIADDIVEEVARIYGYDSLVPTLPAARMEVPRANALRSVERRAKQFLAWACGLDEVACYSFISEQQADRYGKSEDCLRLENPIDQTMPLLRRSLMPNLIQGVSKNARFFDEVGIFEVGKTFLAERSGDQVGGESTGSLPLQDTYAGIAIAKKGESVPYFAVRDAVASLLASLGCAFVIRPAHDQMHPWLQQGRSADVLVDGERVGYISELAPQLCRAEKIETPVGIAELNLTTLASKRLAQSQYAPISKYPGITLDISALVPAAAVWADIESAARSVDAAMIRSVELFDVYQGERIGAGKKSVAFHVTYRSDERTLQLAEAEAVHSAIKKIIAERFGAQIR